MNSRRLYIALGGLLVCAGLSLVWLWPQWEFQKLLSRMTNSDIEHFERMRIAWRISEFGDRAVPYLLEILEHDDTTDGQYTNTYPTLDVYQNKFTAVQGLNRIDSARVPLRNALAGMLCDESLSKRCFAALHLLGGNFHEEYLPALMAMLKSNEPEDRYCAAIALGRIGAPADPAVASLLRLLSSDPNPSVRTWSASALGDIRGADPEIIDALTQALKDEHESVRGMTQLTLDKIPKPSNE